MGSNIPDYVYNIIKTFKENGYEIYPVGGCVRDLLLRKKVNDWDFTTNATPEQILKLFPDGFYDNSFGTVGIPLSDITSNTADKNIIEITTFRTEQNYSDGRRPDSVTWGASLHEDLTRRDFTVNAIALKIETQNGDNISSDSLHTTDNSAEYTLTFIDPFNGQVDLENKSIKAVGDPHVRFQEDALRLLRAVRLATQHSFTIEENTFNALKKNANLLKKVSQERIRDELFKILASESPYEGILLLHETGLLEYVLPELLEGIGVSQVRPGRHHKDDVFTHNLLALKLTPSKDPLVRFATLIHDVAKPRVSDVDGNGYVIFHNHEIAGAKLAADISNRLRLSKKQKDKVVTLVRWHMFTVDEHTTDSAIRRFIRRVGIENITDMIDLRIGDRLGSGTQTAESWRLKLFKKRIEEQLAPAPFSINDLAIDGNDIMKILSIPPGKIIGEYLQKLFDEVDEDLSKNTKEYLTKRVMELSK